MDHNMASVQNDADKQTIMQSVAILRKSPSRKMEKKTKENKTTTTIKPVNQTKQLNQKILCGVENLALCIYICLIFIYPIFLYFREMKAL